MAAPQLLSRKANGVLPIAAGQAAANDTPRPSRNKAPIEGEKVVIRRLPPGMTEDEFLRILGSEWTVGKGKVGWLSYHNGKISTDPAKPSRPARAYLHVLKRDHLFPLSETVREAVWEDAKETWTNPALIGPPTTEFAMYKKIPTSKRRSDGRQGTIDQDPEFMDFLEALANPISQKEGETEQTADEDGKSGGKTTTTPLIDYLREKKANKAKEASTKAAKQSKQDSHGAKGKGTSSDDTKRKTKTEKGSEKPKETIKILTKKAAADAAGEAAKAAASQINASKEDLPKSRRAGIAAAARILQRDLGLSPGNAHRRARQQAAQAESDAKAKETKDAEPTSTSAQPSSSKATRDKEPPAALKAQSQIQPVSSRSSRSKKQATSTDGGKGKGVSESSTVPAAATKPVVLLKKKDEAASTQPASGRASPSLTATKAPPTGPKAGSQSKSSQAAGSKRASPVTVPSSGATRAFLKHANPSQGVTEALLKEKLRTYGEITFVEIDRRKGFAYVDFADPDGLVKAMAASPVTIAQANVQVLERKETKKGSGTAGVTSARASGSHTNASVATSSTIPTTPTTPTTPSAEQGAGEQQQQPPHKRGGRRRGGRGRGEGQTKEGKEIEGGQASAKAPSSSAAPAPTAATSAG